MMMWDFMSSDVGCRVKGGDDELMLNVLRYSVDILETGCDQCRSTGSINLYVHGNQKAR